MMVDIVHSYLSGFVTIRLVQELVMCMDLDLTPFIVFSKIGVEKVIDEQAFNMVIGAVKYFRKTIYNNDTTKSKLDYDIVIFYMCSFLNRTAFRSKYIEVWPDFDESIRTYIEPLNIFTPQQISQMMMMR